MRKIRKPPILFLSLFSLLAFSGCASLPKVEDFESSSLNQPPKIIGPQGQLSPKTSKAVIERLEQQAEPTDILQKHATLMESVSGSPLTLGNKVTLLVDGPAAYAAMFKAIQNAKDHINLETYIFDDDEIGQRFAGLLLQKQTEGVQVNLIYDSIGCLSTPFAFFQRLRDSGVQTLEFNPVHPLKVFRKRFLTHRDHRKILIVDGTIAFTGGVNISRVYSKSPSGVSHDATSQGSWRDSHVQIEGPAVAEFQKLFLDTWTREKGPELSKREYFPTLQKKGNDLVQAAGSTPGQRNRITFIMYVSAINYAENSIHLTNSYFAPDRQTIKALASASKRGVDVKIILPGNSDIGLTFYAGRSHFTRLLKSGVKLYERRGAVLHAKTAVIDDVWSTIGSTNMDLWSFLRNDEVNAIILGRDFASEMRAMFERDLEESDQIHLEQWKKRPLKERMREWFSRLLAHWL